MPNGPDPHGDFLIAEGSTVQAVTEQGADQPVGADEPERADEAGSPAAAGAQAETTADTLQPAATPLSVRFGAGENGR
jgi:hypothetical protein